jgi:hypothetical protein
MSRGAHRIHCVHRIRRGEAGAHAVLAAKPVCLLRPYGIAAQMASAVPHPPRRKWRRRYPSHIAARYHQSQIIAPPRIPATTLPRDTINRKHRIVAHFHRHRYCCPAKITTTPLLVAHFVVC